MGVTGAHLLRKQTKGFGTESIRNRRENETEKKAFNLQPRGSAYSAVLYEWEREKGTTSIVQALRCPGFKDTARVAIILSETTMIPFPKMS